MTTTIEHSTNREERAEREGREKEKKKNVYQTNNIIAQHQTWEEREEREEDNDTFIHHTSQRGNPSNHYYYTPSLHSTEYTAHPRPSPIIARRERTDNPDQPKKDKRKNDQQRMRGSITKMKCRRFYSLFRHSFQALAPSFFFCFRGGVICRPAIPPAPYGYLAFFSAGLRICHTHTQDSSNSGPGNDGRSPKPRRGGKCRDGVIGW